jgi:hypothetical protein
MDAARCHGLVVRCSCRCVIIIGCHLGKEINERAADRTQSCLMVASQSLKRDCRCGLTVSAVLSSPLSFVLLSRLCCTLISIEDTTVATTVQYRKESGNPALRAQTSNIFRLCPLNRKNVKRTNSSKQQFCGRLRWAQLKAKKASLIYPGDATPTY